jgi:hypothetical protein
VAPTYQRLVGERVRATAAGQVARAGPVWAVWLGLGLSRAEVGECAGWAEVHGPGVVLGQFQVVLG